MFKRESSGNRSTTSTIRQILSDLCTYITVVAFPVRFFLFLIIIYTVYNYASRLQAS
jgi:hypothetical protein